LDDKASDGTIWEDGSIDVHAHVHILWLDKPPKYIGRADLPTSASHSRATSPMSRLRTRSPVSRGSASQAVVSRPPASQVYIYIRIYIYDFRGATMGWLRLVGSSKL